MATIDGVTVYGELVQIERGGLTEIVGTLKVGDNDSGQLFDAVGREALYTGPVRTPSGVRPMTVPVLINLRMGTAATVVEVRSAGPPRDTP
jgi:hypothetical protein